MRQGQQNRRGRGRSNHNQHHRKGGQNPLTRSFESTGPDTKIRGTPAHIAEKYMALARDALSAGDPVLAENYLQHAEHYNRIIMAYREQMQQSGEFANGGSHSQQNRFQPPEADEFSDEGDEFASDQPVVAQAGEPQPQIQPPSQQQRSFDSQRPDDRSQHQGFEGYRGNPRQHNNRDRFGGEQRGFQERHDRGDRRDRFERGDRGEQRFDRQQQQDAQGGEQRRRDRERFAPVAHEQPEFLRRPVRRPRREGEEDEVAAAAPNPDDSTSK